MTDYNPNPDFSLPQEGYRDDNGNLNQPGSNQSGTKQSGGYEAGDPLGYRDDDANLNQPGSVNPSGTNQSGTNQSGGYEAGDPLTSSSIDGGQGRTGTNFREEFNDEPSLPETGGGPDDPSNAGFTGGTSLGGYGLNTTPETGGTGTQYEGSGGNDYGEPAPGEEPQRRVKPTVGQEIKGITDEIIGKVTRNRAKVERGQQLRSGEQGGYNQA